MIIKTTKENIEVVIAEDIDLYLDIDKHKEIIKTFSYDIESDYKTFAEKLEEIAKKVVAKGFEFDSEYTTNYPSTIDEIVKEIDKLAALEGLY